MTTPACEAASSTAAVAAAVPAHASAAAPAATGSSAAATAWKPRDPNLDHLTSSTFEHVYEPCEDSYLLMDALHADLIAADAASWISGGSHKRCLEVGPGSGIIISYLSQLLRRRGYFLAVDINPRACQTTRQTMRANGVVGDVLQGNLTDCIATRMEHQLDILIFNPPYVPTPASELLGDGISRSWAGGEKGREVLDMLLPQVQRLLAPRGVFYCVLLSSNLPDEVAEILAREGGFRAHTVLRRRAGIEDLQIVRYSRPIEDEQA